MKISKKDYTLLMKSLYRERPEVKGIEGYKNGLNEPQQKLMQAYKDPNITTIFCSWGRKCGKTFGVCGPVWEAAITTPNSEIIYVAPTRKLATDIVWTNKRLQNFLGVDVANHFIKGSPNNRELIIFLKNGSYIRLMGSENYENANGLSPDLVIYDEFKAFHPEFHRTMSMNSAAKGAKLIIIGTKADYLARNRKQYNSMLEIAKKDKSQVVIEATTFDNPINNTPKRLKRIMDDIAALRAQGLEEVVQREYYNKIIPGGSNAIFPEFSPKSHVVKHKDVMAGVHKEFNEGQFYQIIDPATSSVFGGLFIFHNPYTGRVRVMDELYEEDLKNVGITKVFPKIRQIAADLTGSDNFAGLWYPVYDEAALWAANEIMDNYNVAYVATSKAVMSQEGGISIMKYLFTKNLIEISDRCNNFIEEILGYKRDGNGQIKKGLCADHNIDCISKGELISTTKGQIPIEDIKVGDLVYTNLGIDEVTDTWSKGESNLIKLTFTDGSSIKCTPDHKIYTNNRGFIEARLLTHSDTFDTLSVWKKKKLYIKELFLDATQTLRDLVIGNIIGPLGIILKEVYLVYIDMYTSVKKALFPRGGIYITSTITRAIMNQVILKRYLLKNIINYTRGIAQKSKKKIWIESDTLLKLGTLVKKARSGIHRIVKECGIICHRSLKIVKYVNKNMKFLRRVVTRVNTATKTVRLLHSEDVGKGLVYDLTTKKYNRFYVNGKLVHNCMRYFIQASNYTVNLENKDINPVNRPEEYYTRGLQEELNKDSIFNIDLDIDLDFNLDDF